MPANLAELEARVAALEAERADYRAVLTAVNALGENQREQAAVLREHTAQLRDTNERVRSIESNLTSTDARVRSIEENVAEVKDLLVRALDRRDQD
jgi:DNA repair exonuclease SbcCD ATPase subunit